MLPASSSVKRGGAVSALLSRQTDCGGTVSVRLTGTRPTEQKQGQHGRGAETSTRISIVRHS